MNFGVLPLTFADGADYDRATQGDTVRLRHLHAALRAGHKITAEVGGRPITLKHELSPRQVDVLLACGVINWLRQRVAA